MPVCSPSADKLETKSENLGEVITGNRIESSLYELKMLQKSTCLKLCQKDLTAQDILNFKDLIKDEYVVQWQVDSLPAAVKARSQKTGEYVYETGFSLGYESTSTDEPKQSYLNNHVHITINYNQVPSTTESEEEKQYHVILFEVEPRSIAYPSGENWEETCRQAVSGNGGQRYSLDETHPGPVIYTYSVDWKETPTTWDDRWHNYLALQGEGQIHWFSIINSLMIVFFLSGLVAMIMARTIRRDFMKYMEEEKDEVEESGWKQVRTEVFRAPRFKTLFSVLVGSGVQVISMCVVTMVFAVLGFLSPSNSGSLTTAAIVLYVWMGVAAGYSSSRIYMTFQGNHHTRNTVVTAVAFPGSVFGISFFLNFFLWYKGSSGAFPFTTMLAIMALWFCISVPLCFLGSRLAYRQEPIKLPGTVAIIKKPIPDQKWYMNPVFSVMMGGILPFGAIFIELFFIMSSIWLHRYYFLFGFLFLVFVILVITCAEMSVVMCYFQLCSEDWEWWWRSYLTSGASAFYMFLYAIFYYATRLDLDGFVPSLLYYGYSLILCLFFFVLTGTIGHLACFWFVRKIYQVIHQD
uniref:Transmembrane 9 superfamily member n=1 Tax=Arcella intermedia TaxID=1963864 RepID=A0A6B2KZX5_9EUKA